MRKMGDPVLIRVYASPSESMNTWNSAMNGANPPAAVNFGGLRSLPGKYTGGKGRCTPAVPGSHRSQLSSLPRNIPPAASPAELLSLSCLTASSVAAATPALVASSTAAAFSASCTLTCSSKSRILACRAAPTAGSSPSGIAAQHQLGQAKSRYRVPNTARARAAYTAGVLSMGTMLSQYGRQGWSHVVDFQLVGSRAPYSFRGPVWTHPSHTSYLIIRVTPVEDPRSCSYTSTTNSPPAWYDARS